MRSRPSVLTALPRSLKRPATTVVRLLPDDLADVDTGEGTEQVSVALVSAGVGDTIVVHAGEAIAVVGR